MKTTLKTDNIQSTVVIDSEVWMKFTHEEAQLLSDIAGYGAEAFMKVFKEKLGKHYIEQHEKSIVPLFKKLYNELQAHHNKVESIKALIQKQNTD